MKKLLFLFVCLCFNTSIYAKAVMIVAPLQLGPVTLLQTGSLTINYSVTNNTNTLILSRFSITPGFNVSPNASYAVSLRSNACTQPLLPGQTCQFQVGLQGNVNLPSTFVLSPRVCAYTVGGSSTICSQPIALHRTPVFVESHMEGCTGNGYGTACYIMVSKNQMQGNMNILLPTPQGAPDVSACNAVGAISKADCICNIEGRAANQGNGTWKAWLGLNTGGNNNPRQRLDNLLGHSAFPTHSSWVSLENGLTVYPNWGMLGYNINNYGLVSNFISILPTVVNTGGYNLPASTAALTCMDWTSASNLDSVDIAVANGNISTNLLPNSWNNTSNSTCDVYRPIYCTQVSP